MTIEFVDISGYENWRKIDPLDKGWSSDKKYYVETITGEKFLLRISSMDTYEVKKYEFEQLSKLNDIDINISKVKDFGVCSQNKSVYLIFSWVDGDEAEIVIPKLSDAEQYNLGYKAGEILREIHSIDISDSKMDWELKYNAKLDRNIRNYLACGIRIENDDSIIKFINENRHLLRNRPISIQQGDYHIGNMVVDENKRLGVIDFNRFDVGDPWEEFNRITWCADISKYFATGRINGYFSGKVPDEFFRLLALYIGGNQLSSIPWAMNYCEEQVNVMKEQMRIVLDSYCNYSTYIPNWYIR